MKRPFGVWFSIVMLVAAQFLVGCGVFEKGASPNASPSASPTPTPTVTEALASASDDLTRALSELRSRNVRGSLELVDRSIVSLRTAAGGGSSVSRVAIEEALKKLEATRDQIANGDKKADEALAKVESTVSGLLTTASSMVSEAKREAARAIGEAADRVKEAVGAPDSTPTPQTKKK